MNPGHMDSERSSGDLFHDTFLIFLVKIAYGHAVGGVLMLLIILYPVAAIYAMWPGKWTALVGWARTILWVSMWPAFFLLGTVIFGQAQTMDVAALSGDGFFSADFQQLGTFVARIIMMVLAISIMVSAPTSAGIIMNAADGGFEKVASGTYGLVMKAAGGALVVAALAAAVATGGASLVAMKGMAAAASKAAGAAGPGASKGAKLLAGAKGALNPFASGKEAVRAVPDVAKFGVRAAGTANNVRKQGVQAVKSMAEGDVIGGGSALARAGAGTVGLAGTAATPIVGAVSPGLSKPIAQMTTGALFAAEGGQHNVSQGTMDLAVGADRSSARALGRKSDAQYRSADAKLAAADSDVVQAEVRLAGAREELRAAPNSETAQKNVSQAQVDLESAEAQRGKAKDEVVAASRGQAGALLRQAELSSSKEERADFNRQAAEVDARTAILTGDKLMAENAFAKLRESAGESTALSQELLRTGDRKGGANQQMATGNAYSAAAELQANFGNSLGGKEGPKLGELARSGDNALAMAQHNYQEDGVGRNAFAATSAAASRMRLSRLANDNGDATSSALAELEAEIDRAPAGKSADRASAVAVAMKIIMANEADGDGDPNSSVQAQHQVIQQLEAAGLNRAAASVMKIKAGSLTTRTLEVALEQEGREGAAWRSALGRRVSDGAIHRIDGLQAGRKPDNSAS